eukprot:TRINITY_DN847_c0_g1_i1.p1 TRINITY_DN847_c0_g1~~TRINITY_DN847_c0_g1_i1.p1  ORF type:complete len:290 (-),score=79.12 TRINITY_DN847_c0_g1_i1:78-884(-)
MSASPNTVIDTYPRLAQKTVLITGASAGIGEASALCFAASGANVIVTARRVEKLNALKAKINESYPNVTVHAHALDVQKPEDYAALKASLPEALKVVDIIVLNAGLAIERTHLESYDLTQVDTMINTNVKGVVHGVQAFVPAMRERDNGHVIVMGSVAGTTSYKGGSIYCATKFAVEALADALRQEVIDTEIRVTKISPGAVQTSFSIVRLGSKEAADAVYAGYTPIYAQDVADTVLYAASRPPHVQVVDITVTCTAQATATMIHRKQ